MTTLTDQERRAVNELICQEYGAFQEIAARFLSDDEIQELEEKLAKEQP